MLFLLPAAAALNVGARPSLSPSRCAGARCVASLDRPTAVSDELSAEQPLHVLIAGAGVGGLALANCLELQKDSHITYTVLE